MNWFEKNFGKNGATSTDLVLIEPHAQRLHFEEDMTLLGIDMKRVFRRAVEIDAEMGEAPDIEGQAAEAVEGLDKAIAELDEARDGHTDADVALADWKEELAVGQASQAR